MEDYQLTIKQIVDLPRHRVCSAFVKTLARDHSIQMQGNSDLFYYMALCASAATEMYFFSDGTTEQPIYPGGHGCEIHRLMRELRIGSRKRLDDVLNDFQKRGLITYAYLSGGKYVCYQILDWSYAQKCMSGKCPKDGGSAGFFFILDKTVSELINNGACSDMTILIDLYLSTVHIEAVSSIPFAYYGGEVKRMAISMLKLARRWQLSAPKAMSALERLTNNDFILLNRYRCADNEIVIFLNYYPAVMLKISDIPLDKKHIPLLMELPLSTDEPLEVEASNGYREVNIDGIANSVAEQIRVSLEQQDIRCANCPYLTQHLVLIQGKTETSYRMDFRCGGGKTIYKFTFSIMRRR